MKKISILLLFAPILALGAETNAPYAPTFPRWGPSVRGGSVYNFKTDMEGAGAFSVNRYFLEAGVARMWSYDRMISFSAGFGQDDYRFSGLDTEPWNNIDNYRASLFARWRTGERWAFFVGPSIRSYGETGTDLDDAMTLAAFGGVSYEFGDRLTLGPGVGVFEQIEDDVRYFPILIINWKITERLSVETGGGLAATTGPGLTMVYDLSKKWKALLSTRFENKRFRLNDEGLAPNGVAEDRNVPIYGQLSYFIYPGGSVSGVFGYNFAGKLSADDPNGNLLYESEYDPAPVLGLVASFRF